MIHEAIRSIMGDTRLQLMLAIVLGSLLSAILLAQRHRKKEKAFFLLPER